VTILRQRRFEPGQGIGVLSPNRPEVWLGQTAAPFAGGRFTALHRLGSLDDHRYACDEAELRFLFVDPRYAERAAALSVRRGGVLHRGPKEGHDRLRRLAARAVLDWSRASGQLRVPRAARSPGKD
jgi:fatty-acyl-CoA synthase